MSVKKVIAENDKRVNDIIYHFDTLINKNPDPLDNSVVYRQYGHWQLLKSLYVNVEKCYPQLSNKISWQKLSKILSFFNSIFAPIDLPESADNLNAKQLNNFNLIESLDFIFTEGNIIEEQSIELRETISRLFLLYVPDSVLPKIKLPIKTLTILNIFITNEWILLESFRLLTSIKTNFNKTDFILEKKSLSLIFKTYFDQKRIEFLTKKQKRIFSMIDLNEEMKPTVDFWNSILDRTNLKLLPNQKYTSAMFDYTTSLKSTQIANYLAYILTLEKFEYDSSKSESYGKQYIAYQKKRK